MKRWTQHQPRASQLLDSGQFNSEQLAHRASIQTLDRTQLPTNAITSAQLKSSALHKVWLFDDREEQTNFVATNVPSDQWRCATFINYSGGYVTAFEKTLTGHKGGMTYIEWSGLAFNNGFAPMKNGKLTTYELMEKHLRLRIVASGLLIGEFQLLLAGTESFCVFSSVNLPPGDHIISLQFDGTGQADDEPIKDVSTNNRIMQYHLANTVLLAVARFR